MTHQQFRAMLKDLGLSQIDAATFLRVQPTTVNRWATGKRAVPGPVIAALECLRERRVWEAQARTLPMTLTTHAPFVEAHQRRDSRPPRP